MPENTPQPYTPTPWHRNVSPAWKYPIYAGDKGDWTYVGSVTAPGNRNRNLTDEACEGNLNLIIASVNSYSRHCGPNAIQCAEDDLLGQALDSIIRTYQDGDIKSLSAVYYKLRDLGIIERIEAEQEVES